MPESSCTSTALCEIRNSRTLEKLSECMRNDALLTRLSPVPSLSQKVRKPLDLTPPSDRSVLK